MLCPEQDLGFSLSKNSICTNDEGYRRHIMSLEQGHWGEKAFNCCGASGISHLTGSFRDDKQVQSFLAFFVRHCALDTAYYYIITDPEFYKGNIHHIAGLLDAIGAEVVDRRPNRVHGPAIMYMMVWEPSRHFDKLDKYVKRYPADIKGGYAYPEWGADPLWFFDKEEKKGEVKETPVPVKIAQPPAQQIIDGYWPGLIPQKDVDKITNMAVILQQKHLLDKRPDIGIANKSGLMDQWLINEGAQQNVPDKW